MSDVSIVIVNWNTCDLLQDCLESVYATAGDLDIEVVVVDNASQDHSLEMVRTEFPRTRLIENTYNAGFARANNQAIRESCGRYILLLNSDTIVRPGALEKMILCADSHPRAGIVGCKLLNADGSLQPSWSQFPTFWSELWGLNIRRRQLILDGTAFDVDSVGGACLLARRQSVDQVGLLDEGFFMYSEEVDWCYRMKQQRWKVLYVPEARVVHLGGGSSRKASGRMLVQLYLSKLRFYAKHYGLRRAKVLRLSMLSVLWGKELLLSLGAMFSAAARSARCRQRALRRALSVYRCSLTD